MPEQTPDADRLPFEIGVDSELAHYAEVWRRFKTPREKQFVQPVAVRPLHLRLRDYAIAYGTVGAFVGMAHRAARDAPLLGGALYVGGSWAASAAAFVGLRHALINGDWKQDREAVSGLAGAFVGAGVAVMSRHTAMIGKFSIGGFTAGYVGHFAHRFWLRYRFDM